MLCKRTIDDEDGFMKCCPNEEYIKGWMDLTETYLPCCFHKVCRLCFLENFSRIQNFPRYVISESMRCFIPGCKNNYFLGDLNRWSHKIEDSILRLIYGNQLVMKKQIFGLKIFK
uniref:Uncharacterized protein n=1 Tax=Panagrolaimus superbus TaxID=310955 RepID=A0A914Z747_9BILA